MIHHDARLSHDAVGGRASCVPAHLIPAEEHTMPLSLAGVSLIAPGPKVFEWIGRNIPVEDACPWGVRAWPGPELAGVAFPSATAVPRRLKVSSLWWPTGSRFAYAHMLADGRAVEQIRAAANGGDGAGSNPITLHMSSGAGDSAEAMETDLTLLRVVPLSQVPAEDDDHPPSNMYLLTLVDARYYWQSAPAPDFKIKVADASVTWADCFAMLGEALGIAIEVDPIDPAYLYPDVSLNAPGASCAVLLDACAANVGKRVVRKLDGRVMVMGFDASQQVRQADDQAHPGRRLKAGGDWYRDTL